MIVSIHQPQYLPWPGYWDKMARSDIFVLLDNVQFKKNEWQNRNRIRTPEGWQWVTVPVCYSFGQKINEVRIENKSNWRRKHVNAVRLCYSRSTYYGSYQEELLGPLEENWEKLSDLNLRCIHIMKKILGIKTKLLLASEIEPLPGESTARLVAVCRELGADAYLSGSGAREYLEVGKFERAGLDVIFQDYVAPVYPQLFGNFVEGLSAVDILFNCGERSLRVIRNEGHAHSGSTGSPDTRGGIS